MGEEINPDALSIALLQDIKHLLQSNQAVLEVIRKNQERNSVHLKYEVDLSVAHSEEEIADFVKMGLDIDTLTVMPVPSPMSLRLRGISSELIELEKKETINIPNQVITRILVTNAAAAGTARIHVFGKYK